MRPPPRSAPWAGWSLPLAAALALGGALCGASAASSGDAAGAAVAAPFGEESRSFLEAFAPEFQAYRQVVADYNRRSGPESAWYQHAYDFGQGGLPAAPTPADQELRRLFLGAVAALEQFRSSHNYAVERTEALMSQRGGQLGSFDDLALVSFLITLGQSYKRWYEANGYLAQRATERLGVRLAEPRSPPYLDRLRGYLRQTSGKAPVGAP